MHKTRQGVKLDHEYIVQAVKPTKRMRLLVFPLHFRFSEDSYSQVAKSSLPEVTDWTVSWQSIKRPVIGTDVMFYKWDLWGTRHAV